MHTEQFTKQRLEPDKCLNVNTAWRQLSGQESVPTPPLVPSQVEANHTLSSVIRSVLLMNVA